MKSFDDLVLDSINVRNDVSVSPLPFRVVAFFFFFFVLRRRIDDKGEAEVLIVFFLVSFFILAFVVALHLVRAHRVPKYVCIQSSEERSRV